MADLDLLESNCREIFKALPHDDRVKKPDYVKKAPGGLVANLSATRIYSKANCWGRFWEVFYAIIGIFAGDSLRQRKLKEAIIKTNTIFNENRIAIEKHIKTYNLYLRKCLLCKQENISEETASISRRAITDWNNSTRGFLKYIKKNNIQPIFEIFRHNLKLRPTERLHFLYPSLDPKAVKKDGKAIVIKTEPLKEETTTNKSVTSDGAKTLSDPTKKFGGIQLALPAPSEEPFGTELLEKCINYQRIIDWQGMHPDPEPTFFFGMLSTIICKQRMDHSAVYIRKRDKFIEKLNELFEKKEISIDFVYRMFKTIYELVEDPHNDKNLALLFCDLDERGCKLMQAEDPAHMRWRNDKVKPNAVLSLTTKEGEKLPVKIGKQIGAKPVGQDKNIYFEYIPTADELKEIREKIEINLDDQTLKISKFNGVISETHRDQVLAFCNSKQPGKEECKTESKEEVDLYNQEVTLDANQANDEQLVPIKEKRNSKFVMCKENEAPEAFYGMKSGNCYVVKESNLYKKLNDRLVWVSCNPMILHMKELERETFVKKNLLQVADFKAIDADGRFAVVERLVHPLNDIAWESKGTKITKNDEKACEEILELLQKLVKKQKTPQNFSPKTLMLSRDGFVKSFRIPSRIDDPEENKSKPEFDFNAIEDFCVELNNFAVFKHLMKDSGILKHDSAHFYRKMVQNAIDDKNRKAEKVATEGSDTEPSVIDRGQDLYKDVVALKRRCCERIRKKSKGEIQNLEVKVKNKIHELYLESEAAGVLWPSIEDTVVYLLSPGDDK